MKKLTFFLTFLCPFLGFAQFNLDGQMLQRAEYRNGFSNLIENGQEPAAFIAHRVRLQASYSLEKFKFYASIQDVRTWGNTPQVKATDGFLSLHEAWTELNINDKWSLKLGRQELNYDNFRFLGNLDWALQGRSHDFLLVKYEKEKQKIHFGGGFNQQDQRLNSTTYTLANQYKTAQFFRYENQWNNFQLSFLFWNDGRENAGKNLFRQTIGFPTIKYQMGNTTFSAFYYHQLGKTQQNKEINGFDANFQIKHQIDINKESNKKLQLVGGFEIISGTAGNESTKSSSFSPLYGTNHLFNGYMDWFFVGGTFENNVGLQDYYLKARYDFSQKFFVQSDVHYFATQAKAYRNNQEIDAYLGTEIDFSLGYVFTDAVSLQAGYSQFLTSSSAEYLKGAVNPQSTQNWAYMMLIIRPTMKNKFIGILL